MAYELDQETVLIHIDDIVVGRNIENIRKHMIKGSIEELAQSIYEDGLLQAIIVMDTEDPDSGDEITELVAGSRRLRAIRHILENIDSDWTCDTENAEPGMIKASQYTGTLEDAEMLNGVENIEREEVDEVDTAAWLYRMVEENGWVQADLAKKLKKSGTWVSSRITLHKRGSDLLKKAMRHDFLATADDPKGGALMAFSTAYHLAKNLSKEEQDKRINKAIKDKDKIISLEEAERAGDDDKTKRPSKKSREKVRGTAEGLASTNAEKFINARGVAMALRWVDGLLTEEEILEVIQWESALPSKAVPDSDPDPEDE